MFLKLHFKVKCLDSRAAAVMTRTTNTVSLVSLCGVTFLTELVSGCMNLISIPCASAGSAGEFSIHGLFIYLICGTEANFCLSVLSSVHLCQTLTSSIGALVSVIFFSESLISVVTHFVGCFVISHVNRFVNIAAMPCL